MPKDEENLECKLCTRTCIGYRGLGRHLRSNHNLNKDDIEQYWKNHIGLIDFDMTCPICKINNKKFYTLKKGFSKTCNNKSCLGTYSSSFHKGNKRPKTITGGMTYCGFCGEAFDCLQSLQRHLFGRPNPCYEGELTAKDYYLKFLNPELDPVCQICKTNERKFASMMKGFNPTCIDRSCVGKYGNTKRQPTFNKYKNRELSNAYICDICGDRFELDTGLAAHLSQKNDHPNTEQYYNKYINPDDNPICDMCNIRNRKFVSIPLGYTFTCCSMECITKRIGETKMKNGTFTGQGYSVFPIENIFNPLIEKYDLNKDRCYHSLLENKELSFFVGNLPKFKKRNIKVVSYDFSICDSILIRKPLVICEYNGICFHLKKEEVWKRRHEKDFWGNSLFSSYRKDILKENHIRSRYPDCKYVTIWEQEEEEGIAELDLAIGSILM